MSGGTPRDLTEEAPHEVEIAVEAEVDDSIRAAVRRRIEALKAGDVGSLPVIVGMVLITIFFTAKTSVFFTAVNFDNLIPQMSQVTVMAIGVVFVLLIGEIDLSIGLPQRALGRRRRRAAALGLDARVPVVHRRSAARSSSAP